MVSVTGGQRSRQVSGDMSGDPTMQGVAIEVEEDRSVLFVFSNFDRCDQYGNLLQVCFTVVWSDRYVTPFLCVWFSADHHSGKR